MEYWGPRIREHFSEVVTMEQVLCDTRGYWAQIQGKRIPEKNLKGKELGMFEGGPTPLCINLCDSPENNGVASEM